MLKRRKKEATWCGTGGRKDLPKKKKNAEDEKEKKQNREMLAGKRKR